MVAAWNCSQHTSHLIFSNVDACFTNTKTHPYEKRNATREKKETSQFAIITDLAHILVWIATCNNNIVPILYETTTTSIATYCVYTLLFFSMFPLLIVHFILHDTFGSEESCICYDPSQSQKQRKYERHTKSRIKAIAGAIKVFDAKQSRSP